MQEAKRLKDKSRPNSNFKELQIENLWKYAHTYLQYTMAIGRCPKGVEGAKINSGEALWGRGEEDKKTK